MGNRASDYIRSNVLGLVAIFIALGGTGWAAATIGPADIERNAVYSRHITNGQVRSPDIGRSQVRSPDIGLGQVRRPDLAPGAVTAPKLANAAVRTPKLANGAVTRVKVKTNSLTGAEINEATLAKVPNAGALDGVDSTGFWKLAGNSATTGSDFLGTTDNRPLNLDVNGARALRLEPASDGVDQSPNVIGGFAGDSVTAGVFGATIAGGGRRNSASPGNRVTDDFGSIGGGASNQAGDDAGTTSDQRYATVGGGLGNGAVGFLGTVGGGAANATLGDAATVGGGSGNAAIGDSTFVGGGALNLASGAFDTVGGGEDNAASGTHATVAGGSTNTASGSNATVGGGQVNTASGADAIVGGGALNTASGASATVPGGAVSTAAGQFSLAAGRRAKANHDGAFVWADSQTADMASSAINQFVARAQGHFFLQSDSTLDDQGGFINTSTGGFLSTGGTWTNSSDENLKSDVRKVAPREVLAKVARLPITSWEYDAEPGVRHLGPMAQAFRRAFGLGADNRHISSVDADGVSLAAIKGLSRENARLRSRLAELEQEVADIRG